MEHADDDVFTGALLVASLIDDTRAARMQLNATHELLVNFIKALSKRR